MADPENSFQPSKKRTAGVQLSRDNPGLDDDEPSELEAGTFKRASDEVLAARRIVRVRRQQTSSTPSAPGPATAQSSNPFAAIRLVPPANSDSPPEVEERSITGKETEQNDKTDCQYKNEVDEPKGESTAEEGKTDTCDDNAERSETKVDESKVEPNAEKNKTDDVSEQNVTKSVVENVDEGENSGDGAKNTREADNCATEAKENAEDRRNDEEENLEETTGKNTETASFSSFQQLSSGQNAFSGLAGTGFSSTLFSFGSISKDGSPLGSTSGSLFGLKNDQPSFSFGISNNGNSSVFGATGANVVNKKESSKFPSMQEVHVETGEENEKTVFTADSVLFEFIDGVWKERGKGELKVNVSTTGTGKSRLVMRARGNYRLILNASLFPDLKLTNMDKKGITFACVNSAGEGKDGLSTIALKFKDSSIVEEFQATVMEHKDKTPVALKTPESSPKASDE